MEILEFINLNYINIILIVGFIVGAFILNIYKRKKTLYVYIMFGLSIANLFINYFNLKNPNDTFTYLYNLFMVLIVYLCSLVVVKPTLLSHLILTIPVITQVILSFFFSPQILMTIISITYFVFIIINSLIDIKRKKKTNVNYIIIICSIIDIVSILFHYSNNNLPNDIASIIITTIAVHVAYFIKEYNDKRLNEEKKIQTQRTSIAISQIQPHFLYNSLATIGYICKKDANMASIAIDKFSDYLRANLNSLKQETNILFSEELKHVQTYLWLEKLRFEDRLQIDYDIQVDNFFVPPLSIQPLVENAVKHGICNKIEGGRLTIRTVDYYNCIKIIIEDTGVGFDTKKKPNDGRTHVGIENVKDRIKNMANGVLEIKSTIGVGTTSTITIPKNMEE